MYSKRRWIIYSISGLLFFGFGLSLLGESIILKYTNHHNWAIAGTLALVVTNAGLCLFGQAILEKGKENRT